MHSCTCCTPYPSVILSMHQSIRASIQPCINPSIHSPIHGPPTFHLPSINYSLINSPKRLHFSFHKFQSIHSTHFQSVRPSVIIKTSVNLLLPLCSHGIGLDPKSKATFNLNKFLFPTETTNKIKIKQQLQQKPLQAGGRVITCTNTWPNGMPGAWKHHRWCGSGWNSPFTEGLENIDAMMAMVTMMVMIMTMTAVVNIILLLVIHSLLLLLLVVVVVIFIYYYYYYYYYNYYLFIIIIIIIIYLLLHPTLITIIFIWFYNKIKAKKKEGGK